MALDLEEQEQVAELKAWWNQHGNLIVSAITAAALAFAGWQGWRWYERNQASQAGSLYDTLVRAARAGDAKALRDADRVALDKAGSGSAAFRESVRMRLEALGG